MTSTNDGLQRRIIPFLVVVSVLCGIIVLVILQRPPFQTMVLVGVGLLDLIAVLWFVGPENRRKLLPVESLRQAITRKWTCSGCGAVHPAREVRCENCGAFNPTKIWHCPVCEATVTKDLHICTDCGTAKPEPQ